MSDSSQAFERAISSAFFAGICLGILLAIMVASVSIGMGLLG